MSQVTDLKGKRGFWALKGPHSDSVLNTRMRLARNIPAYPFPSTGDAGVLSTVRDMVAKSVRENLHKKGKLLSVASLSPEETAVFRERGLVDSKCLDNPETTLYLFDDPFASLVINREDHLAVQVYQPGLQLEEAFDYAMELDSRLNQSLIYAFHEETGHLTANPKNSGHGLKASVMVHLPVLARTGKDDEVLDSITFPGMEVRKLYSTTKPDVTPFYIIAARGINGESEQEMLKKLGNTLVTIVSYEDRERDHLWENEKNMVEDLVFRAWGILTNARFLEFSEAIDLLSTLRMGIVLGLINSVDILTINDAMVTIQPGHISGNTEKETKKERAAMVRELLSGGVNV